MPANTLSLSDTSCVKWSSEVYNKLEDGDRLLRFLGSDGVLGIAHHSYALSTGESNSIYATLGDPLQALRTGPSLLKSGLKAVDVFSGEMFRRWAAGGAKDWLEIAMDICIVVARFFNPITWLHKIKAIDLGKHAGWMNITVACAFTSAMTFSFVQSVNRLIDSVEKNENTSEKTAKMLQNFFDVVSSPWECGVCFVSTPVLGLVGAILSTFAAGGYLLVEWIYGNPASKKCDDAMAEIQRVQADAANAAKLATEGPSTRPEAKTG